MSITTVFTTPGRLDIRAITTFGMSAKPGTRSPIGQFGTGLKYAIAVILRHGLSVEINIDGTEYVLYTKTDQFRGAEFDHVRMKRREGLLSRWQYESLPFTTELGKHWKLWQAFRELQSNTLDERGTTQTVDTPPPPSSGTTQIRVIGEEFASIAEGEESVFLSDATPVLHSSPALEIREGRSRHLYYRGIRVYDLEKPSQHTYNFLCDMTLTEDRTLASVWSAGYTAVTEIGRHDVPETVIETALENTQSWERGLDWEYAGERVREIARYMSDPIPALAPRYTPEPSPPRVSIRDTLEYVIDELRGGSEIDREDLARRLEELLENS